VSRFSPADLLLLLVVLVWGTDFAVLKWALADMHPHVANALRFVVSASVLGIVYLLRCWRQGTPVFGPVRSRWRTVVLLGLLGFGGFPAALMVGLEATTAGTAALIMTTNPIWTAVLGWVLGTEQLGRGGWGGLLVALAGAGLVIAGGAADGALGEGGTLFGNVMMLLAAVLWGSYTALTKRLVDRASPLPITFFGVLAALPLLLGVGAAYESTVSWSAVDGWAVASLLFSGGLAVGLMFVFWNQGIRRVGSSSTAVYYYLVPVVALIAGAVLLGEPITVVQLAGGGLIIGGLVLVRRTGKESMQDEEAESKGSNLADDE
jgi:drug/metabolite transporter (DMT)-like permease